jgi:hypothetical protein
MQAQQTPQTPSQDPLRQGISLMQIQPPTQSSSQKSLQNHDQPSHEMSMSLSIPAKHKVFIAFTPYSQPSWQTYIPIVPTVPYCEGYTISLIIIWEFEVCKYQIVPHSVQFKPFARDISTLSVESSTLEDKLKDWCSSNPLDNLHEVGYTNRTPIEVKSFSQNWRKGTLKVGGYRTLYCDV